MSTAHFIVGNTCNNGCRGCLWVRRLELLTPVTLPPPAEVRGRGVRLAGREPTMRSDITEVVRALHEAGAAGIELETNGRALCYPAYVKKLRDAGVTRLAVKLFGRDEAAWEAHTRAKGSFDQTLRGIETVRRVAPRVQLIALIVPRRDAGAGLAEMVEFARGLGFEQARVDLRLAKLDLGALRPLAAEVRRLRDNPPTGMRVDVSAG